jgi:Trk-type K+ transport system membrane component
MAEKGIYHFAIKAFCYLMAFTLCLPSRGALPASLSLKDHAPRHVVTKRTTSVFLNKARPFSSLAVLMKKHPKVFWKGIKSMTKNYLLRHKSPIIQDGNLSAADQKAKTSFILGILALALSWLPYTLIPAIVLAVLSIYMDRKAREMGSEQKTGKNLAIVALVVSVVVLLVTVMMVISFLTGIHLLFNG